MKSSPLILVLLTSLFIATCGDGNFQGSNILENKIRVINKGSSSSTCDGGFAANRYPCHKVDLLAHLSPQELNGEQLNDIWGWTDPATGKEYALVGLTDGVSFVDISNPTEPELIGKLRESPTVSDKVKVSSANGGNVHGLYHDDYEGKSTWRDFKVYQNYLYVVSDAQPHGMQVFDLTRLRNVDSAPETFSEDYLYSEFASAHNIAINEETGFAYVVGSNTYGGGLHIVDIRNPETPVFAGHHADTLVGQRQTGYVHDTQCVVYQGPDTDYQGDEICFSSSETHLVIANVSDKDSAYTIARSQYDGVQYAHQGWITEDQQFFLLDDEFDERSQEINTRSIIWDLRDLDNPEVIGYHQGTTSSIDHNQYVKGNYVYQSNYTSGLRILNLERIGEGELSEVAWFDTHPEDDSAEFDGAWSNFPFFGSGIIVVSDMSAGLFVLQPTID